MILQALVQHYEDLSGNGKIVPPGWGLGKISYALYIDEKGYLLRTASVQTEQVKGKKTVLAPQSMQLPAPVKRTMGIVPNFLWDNSSYLLGVNNKGDKDDEDKKDNAQRAMNCFAACKELHLQLLSEVDTPAAKALCAFFQNWDPTQAAEHPALQEDWDKLLSGVNLVFRYNGAFVHEDPAIRAEWQKHYSTQSDGPQMVCLVTGQKGPIEAVHPSIKGVAGAQSSGAALVSFNAPAFCSYGRKQNLNAPVSQYAAFAYTTALNHLLSDREHVYQIGDTTVVCWAEGGESVYQGLFGLSLFGASDTYEEQDLRDMVKKLVKGESVHFDETRLDPNKPFYVLGLSPNAARLSVRFFLRNSFGTMLKNVQAHDERLEIIRPAYDKQAALPIWKLLGETVNRNARDKSPSPVLAGEVLRAILTNTNYPATLLNGVVLRIRAEHEVTRGRAAIIKAYYLKNSNQEVPKEVLTVSLNPDSTNVPYVLGRLFSILEAIQSAANPGINATIKDKYFNSASSIPATVFPTLLNLAQKHLRKLKGSNPGLSIFYEKQLSELAAVIGNEFPARLNLPQQGSFQLGYYHQTAARYQKKEENNHV
jgi:CRISPR-associated protein Csd1